MATAMAGAPPLALQMPTAPLPSTSTLNPPATSHPPTATQFLRTIPPPQPSLPSLPPLPLPPHSPSPPPSLPIDPSLALLLGFSDVGPTEDLTSASDLSSRLGPNLASGPSEEPWQPRGVLVAHLQEHRGPVGSLAVAPGGDFVLSASDDGSVKVWDLTRAGRGTNFVSRLTYAPAGEEEGHGQPGEKTVYSEDGREGERVGSTGGGASDRDSGGRGASSLRAGRGGSGLGRASCVAVLADGRTAAVGFSSGALHVLQIDYVARFLNSQEQYRGVTRAPFLEPSLAGRGEAVEDPILSVQLWASACPPPSSSSLSSLSSPSSHSLFSSSSLGSSPSLLLYSTLKRGVSLWDMRASSLSFCLSSPPAYGSTPHFCLDPVGGNWVVTASTRGVLTLWDVRFLLPVATWHLPIGSGISALTPIMSYSSPVEANQEGSKKADGMEEGLARAGSSNGSMWEWGGMTGFGFGGEGGRGEYTDGSPLKGGVTNVHPWQSLPLVAVAAGRDEVSLWGAHDGRCYEVRVMR